MRVNHHNTMVYYILGGIISKRHKEEETSYSFWGGLLRHEFLHWRLVINFSHFRPSAFGHTAFLEGYYWLLRFRAAEAVRRAAGFLTLIFAFSGRFGSLWPRCGRLLDSERFQCHAHNMRYYLEARRIYKSAGSLTSRVSGGGVTKFVLIGPRRAPRCSTRQFSVPQVASSLFPAKVDSTNIWCYFSLSLPKIWLKSFLQLRCKQRCLGEVQKPRWIGKRLTFKSQTFKSWYTTLTFFESDDEADINKFAILAWRMNEKGFYVRRKILSPTATTSRAESRSSYNKSHSPPAVSDLMV